MKIFQCPKCKWQGTAEDMDSDNYEEWCGEEGVFESGYSGSNYVCPECGFDFDIDGVENYPSEEFLLE